MRANNKLELKEVLALLTLSLLSLLAVYPLLEEWGTLTAINASGFSYVTNFSDANVMRPLHLIPPYIMWLLGQGTEISVALFSILMINCRYFIVRWAVSPAVDKDSRFILALVAAVLPGWIGVWLGRFASAQFVSLLFFVGFGCCIRLSKSRSIKYYIILAVLVFLSLTIYQALFLAYVAIPIAFELFGAILGTEGSTKGMFKRLIETQASIFSGLFAYIVYVIINATNGSFGYESALIGNPAEHITFQLLSDKIVAVYKSVYLENGFLLGIYLCLVYAVQPQDTNSLKLRRLVWVSFISCLLLPLLSLSYVLILHLRDPDRTLFAVSAFFVVVLFLVLKENNKKTNWNLVSVSMSLVLIFCTLPMVYSVYQYKSIQISIIDQINKLSSDLKNRPLILRDNTGKVGDVYTLLGGTLSEALAYKGQTIQATLCTPAGVDRRHVLAWRYPIYTTERCDDTAKNLELYSVINIVQEGQGFKIRVGE